MTASLAALTHPFPLIRGGGIFLICVGLGFFLGLFFPRRWIPLAAGGFIVGFTGSGLSAFLPSLGTPSVLNIVALVVAVAFEAAVIVYLVKKIGDSDERRLTLSIMLVVGLHFVIMGPRPTDRRTGHPDRDQRHHRPLHQGTDQGVLPVGQPHEDRVRRVDAGLLSRVHILTAHLALPRGTRWHTRWKLEE